MINAQKLPPEEEFFLTAWRKSSTESQEEYALQMFRANLKLVKYAEAQQAMIAKLATEKAKADRVELFPIKD